MSEFFDRVIMQPAQMVVDQKSSSKNDNFGENFLIFALVDVQEPTIVSAKGF